MNENKWIYQDLAESLIKELKNIEKTKCKYKFKHKDKFNGKEYCTLHNELCEDLSFVCDKNCQVYEDYKELEKYKQKSKDVIGILTRLDMFYTKTPQETYLHLFNTVDSVLKEELNGCLSYHPTESEGE